MEDCFDGFSEEITKWEIIREMIDLDLFDGIRSDHKTKPSVQLLPRQDVILYGTIPKMEQRIYTKCKECRLVFNPRDILSHKSCSGKSHLSTPQSLKKKVKNKGSSSKKSHSTLPPPPLFKKPPSPSTTLTSSTIVSDSKLATTKVSSTKVPKIATLSSTLSTHTITTTTIKSEIKVSGSVHSSKSTSVHSPKSPSKSVTSTAHSLKSLSKSAISTEASSGSNSASASSSSSSSRYKKSRKSNNNTKITKEFDPDVHCGVVEANRGPCTRSITCSNHRISMTDPEHKSTKALGSGYITSIHNSQENAIGTVPVVYMPMSPISVVSPVQFVQIGKNMICLESPQSAMSPPLTTNQSVFLTIPNQHANVKMYKSHPKPVAIPTYGTKKVGGAILLSNQSIECQKSDILLAINSQRKTVNNMQGYRAISLLNHSNASHRPNILKVKSVNKVNCKRPAVEKLNNSDSKQLRLTPNVNGFILHSDISESADAPQSNNCIQEKIALLNMK